MKARFSGWWEQYGPWPYVGLALLVVIVVYPWRSADPAGPVDDGCWQFVGNDDGRAIQAIQDCQQRAAEQATAYAESRWR